MNHDPAFQANLAFMRRTRATEAQLVVEPSPPTFAEIEAWRAAKNLGTYQAKFADDGRVEQITWTRTVDHELFVRWVRKRAQQRA